MPSDNAEDNRACHSDCCEPAAGCWHSALWTYFDLSDSLYYDHSGRHPQVTKSNFVRWIVFGHQGEGGTTGDNQPFDHTIEMLRLEVSRGQSTMQCLLGAFVGPKRNFYRWSTVDHEVRVRKCHGDEVLKLNGPNSDYCGTVCGKPNTEATLDVGPDTNVPPTIQFEVTQDIADRCELIFRYRKKRYNAQACRHVPHHLKHFS